MPLCPNSDNVNHCPYCKSDLPADQAMCIECYFNHVEPLVKQVRQVTRRERIDDARTLAEIASMALHGAEPARKRVWRVE